MRIFFQQLRVALLTFLAFTASATVRYVDLNSTNAMSPYTDWSIAATNIQDAVDVADPGDEVLATNGVYQTGGRVVYGTLTNRVAVTKPLAVRSVNGPEVTVIVGVPFTVSGPDPVRCVYLTNDASLAGFTLTQGGTTYLGDSATNGSGAGVWCESVSALVSNCVISANSAVYDGGGAFQGTLNHCQLVGNRAADGGGATRATLTNCTVAGNSANEGSAGVSFGILNNCLVASNSVFFVPGGQGGPPPNSPHAGGADFSTLKNCALIGNCGGYGGGASSSTLVNCTITGNSAFDNFGGAYNCALSNCIVYFNTSANHNGGTLDHCCTTPLPGGAGNIDDDPQLADVFHLSAGSPCRGAGSAAPVAGTDMDGDAWANPPSIGCDEFNPDATGPLEVTIGLSSAYVLTNTPVNISAWIHGYLSDSRWEFDDATILSNRAFVSRSWPALGDYPVVLRAYNNTYPDGITATVMIHVAKTHFVSLDSTNPVAPYLTWDTAATNIQHAIDSAFAGDEVVVSNGVYQTGGRAISSYISNRVAVTKPVTVRSVNGPVVTSIQGYQVSGAGYNYGTVRCVYLTNGAALIGFTLTNGVAGNYGDVYWNQSGGGVFCSSVGSCVVSNCLLTGNTAFSYGGGAFAGNGTFNNCTFVGNLAPSGGGASGGTLNDCVFISNTATNTGGGASGSTLNRCTLSGNSAYMGGGTSSGTMNACSYDGNWAAYGGGGASDGVLNNCTLAGNIANTYGGGTWYGWVNNCVLTANAASSLGGGAFRSTLANCTLIRNSALKGGGGVCQTFMTNCIVYYNDAPAGTNHYQDIAIEYSCTTPLPEGGTGNFTSDPQLAGLSHLSADSPCRGAGTATASIGVDIDGESWVSPPSVGCDEYQVGAVTGPLNVGIRASFTNVTTGFEVAFVAGIDGRVSGSRWVFDDGAMITNQPFASRRWLVPGTYPVVLWAYNESYPNGISATSRVQVVEPPVHYVVVSNADPVAPFTSWSTAATNIQDAVDAASVAGAQVLVSNGIYRLGGRVVYGKITNRVAVTKPLTVRSVNGPGVTFIEGRQVSAVFNPTGAVRCVYLTNGAGLVGFTLTNGATRAFGDVDREQNGAGAWCEPGGILSSCVLVSNSAFNFGGGTYRGTLNDCLVISNKAGTGGGAYWGVLNNCTVVGNQATTSAGGAYSATLNNCILYYNSAGGNFSWGTFNFCCTTPQPGAGTGNLTNAPLFLSLSGGDLRLQTNSPCINAGADNYVTTATDLDGNPRVIGGTVDLGAYECQAPALLSYFTWLQQHGLSTHASALYRDADADLFNNWQEWIAGTDPTNELSVLRMLTPTAGGPGVTVSWQSVADRTYFLERGTNAGAQPVVQPLASNLVGQAGTTSYTDTNAVGEGVYIYRVGVQQ